MATAGGGADALIYVWADDSRSPEEAIVPLAGRGSGAGQASSSSSSSSHTVRQPCGAQPPMGTRPPTLGPAPARHPRVESSPQT
eukprot:7929616-Pyramimonas_sp.AAC.1